MATGAARIALEPPQLSLPVPHRRRNSGMEKLIGNRMPSLAISWLAFDCLFVSSRYATRSKLQHQGADWMNVKLRQRENSSSVGAKLEPHAIHMLR